MDQAAITAAVQRGCRNPRLSSSDITAMTLRGVTFLGMHVKQVDPSYYLVRKSLTSYTNVFTKPSDCYRIEKIWDLGSSALRVVDASDDGSGRISILVTDVDTTCTITGDCATGYTCHANGYCVSSSDLSSFASSDTITIHDVSGTTEANGVWKVTDSGSNYYVLQNSTFTNAFTSAGYAYKNPLRPIEIKKKLLPYVTNDDDNGWFPRANKIVVDDRDFTNDILIDYDKTPTAITDIDASYHEGLVSFCVTQLIRIPPVNDPKYQDLVEQKRFHQSTLDFIISEIYRNLKATSEPTQMYNHWRE